MNPEGWKQANSVNPSLDESDRDGSSVYYTAGTCSWQEPVEETCCAAMALLHMKGNRRKPYNDISVTRFGV